MNLTDILIPKPRYYARPLADYADCAESQQPRGLQSPHIDAETCGKGQMTEVIRTNPYAHADADTRAINTFPHNPHNPHAASVETQKPLPVTLEYFRAQGVELLPEDLAFLRWHLPKDTVRRNSCIGRYVSEWHDAMQGEPVTHRKANKGRRAANTWLLDL